MATIGMSVPGATGNWTSAGQALLGDPAQAGETDEERKKRLQALQAAQSAIESNLGRGYSGALSMSPAGQTLLK